MSRFMDSRKGFEAGAAGERPAYCTEEHLGYLDDLRESGLVNMFGARPHLQAEFRDLSDFEGATICSYWMRTPDERYEREGRTDLLAEMAMDGLAALAR